MQSYENHDVPIEEELYAQILGREMLKYLKSYDCNQLINQLESDAVHLLSEIKEILDDETLDDKECFYRIDDIVQCFYHHGISISRHDF